MECSYIGLTMAYMLIESWVPQNLKNGVYCLATELLSKYLKFEYE